MKPIEIITWTCVIVFAVTAIATLLQMLGVKIIKNPEYEKILFKVLIVQIVIAAVAAFNQIINPSKQEKPPPVSYPIDKPEEEPTIIKPPETTDECNQEDPPLDCIFREKIK